MLYCCYANSYGNHGAPRTTLYSDITGKGDEYRSISNEVASIGVGKTQLNKDRKQQNVDAVQW